MDRIFHAKVRMVAYLSVFVGGMAFIGCLWQKLPLPAVLTALLLIVLIERLIHTTYTLTRDGHLLINRGRFSSKVSIRISEITRVERGNSMNFGRFHFTEFIAIEYAGGKYIAIVPPVKEEQFLRMLDKYWSKENQSNL